MGLRTVSMIVSKLIIRDGMIFFKKYNWGIGFYLKSVFDSVSRVGGCG